MNITSSAFKDNDFIPSKYTCDGEDISPPLTIEAVPKDAKSLVLISDDPDAPMGTWVHWVIYNIPPTIKQMPENIPPLKMLDNGSIQGKTDFGRVGYGGPCPPSGTHRYFFKLYALDCELDLAPGATKSEVESAMKRHIISQAELLGLYKRHGR